MYKKIDFPYIVIGGTIGEMDANAVDAQIMMMHDAQMFASSIDA